MIFIKGISNDPAFNLAFEEYIMEHAKTGEKYFLLWQNDNAIIIGKHQNTIEEINQEYVREHGIRVVRRPSGGGAVYHDMGNVCFTFIEEREDNKPFDFHGFTQPVIDVLATMGVKAEFNSRNDLAIDGRKFSGNAQLIKKGWVLHHGTLLFDSNLDVVKDALNVKPDKIQSHGTKSVRNRVTNIKEYMTEDFTVQEFMERLEAFMKEYNKGEMTEQVLSPEQIQEIQNLRDTKYGTWEWNYGESPKYELRKDRRFEGGGISIRMNVSKGKIDAIKFFGDFFGNGDIADLENALIGVQMELEHIQNVLEKLNLNYYIAGVTAEQLAELIAF